MADLEITQGDSEYLQIGFTNRSQLPDGHPLKASGFQAIGWGLRFVVKLHASQSDNEGLILPANRFAISGPDQAALQLQPADTASLAVAREGTTFRYWIQLTNGTSAFTAEAGTMLVNKDPALALI